LEVAGNIKLGNNNYLLARANDVQTVIKTARTDDSIPGYLKTNGWGDFSFGQGLAVGYDWPASYLGGRGMIINGNVGIGTTSPATKFQIYPSTGGIDGNLITLGGSGYDSIFGMDTTGAYFYQTSSGRNFSLGSNSSRSQLVLAGGGNVGIGTTGPGKLLDVAGASRFRSNVFFDSGDIYSALGSATDLQFAGWNATDSAYRTIMTLVRSSTTGIGGNVGIGTTTPGATLDVTGMGRFSSTLTASNGFTLTTGTLALPNDSVTDAMVSNTLTASNLVGSGSTTNGVDLATAEVNGILGIANGSTNASSFASNSKFVWFDGTRLVASTYDNASFPMPTLPVPLVLKILLDGAQFEPFQ
jgi:hypothetical protein